jgi:ribosome maturation factor RimP
MANAKSILIEQIEGIVAPVLQEHGTELVDAQFVHEHGQWVLRFFLDKAGGITLGDCAVMSEKISPLLDAADIIKQHYSLEVSSPGINRPLKKEADYQRFIGERVDVTLYAPLNGRRHFKGRLQSVQPGIAVVQEAPEQVFSLPLDDVAKAHLDPEISF